MVVFQNHSLEVMVDHIPRQESFGKTSSPGLNIIREVLVGADLQVHPAIGCLIIGQVGPDDHRLKVFQA